MSTKSFSFKNTNGKNTIRISTVGSVIDFSEKNTFVSVYINGNESQPHREFNAELLIAENNQPRSSSFDIPIVAQEMLIVISANYDLTPIHAALY